MTVSEAVVFFADDREVLDRLEPLAAVGLDYLRLGQPVPTLSGGEAQRLKLAGHLADVGDRAQAKWLRRCSCSTSRPRACTSTTSPKLLGAFKRLLDAGHSLLVIEHNLDVIRAATGSSTWARKAATRGGRLLVAGTPEQVMAEPASHTGARCSTTTRSVRRSSRPAAR